MSDVAPHVGDLALDVTLPDQDSVARSLAAFWQERPTFFVFLRHFG